MSRMRGLHRLSGALQRLQHEAATGPCKLCKRRGVIRASVGFVSGWDPSQPSGVCDEHEQGARQHGYTVRPDPWKDDGVNHDHSSCTHAREGVS